MISDWLGVCAQGVNTLPGTVNVLYALLDLQQFRFAKG
jgi:hypothetical protein